VEGGRNKTTTTRPVRKRPTGRRPKGEEFQEKEKSSTSQVSLGGGKEGEETKEALIATGPPQLCRMPVGGKGGKKGRTNQLEKKREPDTREK